MENLHDLELLEAFIAVAEERHFRRAAERLHVAQPVVSRRIQRLERSMGIALLERTSRHVALTEAGATFLDSARQLLHAADLAVTRAQRVAEGGAGRLSVGFVESVAFELLTPLLRELATRVPDVALDLQELSTERQLSDLEVQVDVAIVRELGDHEPGGDGLRARTLVRERLLVALPRDHALADAHDLALDDLRDEPFVLFPRPPAPRLHDHLLAVCDVAGFRPRITAHAWQYPTMLAMVAAAQGVALVPRCARSVQPPDVRLVPIRDEHATTDLSLAWRAGSSPVLETFIDAAIAVADATGDQPGRRIATSM
jgi:DNA-binding transcriptional LysR family regulator